MAKVKGPLLSMRASGSIAKTNVYASWRGVPYARIHVTPTNPRTIAQLATRAVFTYINALYRSFGAVSVAPWNDATLGRPLTPRNSAVKSNLTLILANTDNSELVGSPGSHGGPALATMSSATGVGAAEINVSMTVGALPTGWVLSNWGGFIVSFQDMTSPFGNDFKEFTAAGPAAAEIVVVAPTAGQVYEVLGWAEYTRPDGSLAYSPSSQDEATSQV